MSESIRFFIGGPPGSRKSMLAERAGEALDLEVEDLTEVPSEGESVPREVWEEVLEGEADIVVMTWGLTEDAGAMREARKAGKVVGVWDHPLNMNERADREIAYDPSRSMKARGGFGNTGRATNEYRRMKRKSDGILGLGDTELDEAVERTISYLERQLERHEAPPEERMRTDRWVQILILDHSADPEAAEKAVEAIAAFLAHLEEEGASRRKTSGVRSDLQAASHLVFSYDAPGPESVLNAFSSPPWVFEFKHKYIDSSRRVKRYERHTRAFADFLESYEHDG